MYREIYRLGEQKAQVEVLEASVQTDYGHLVLSIPPKYRVSSVVGYLKGKLVLRVFQNYPEVKRRLWDGKFWSRGYCVSTVGVDEEKVRKREMASS